MSFISSISRIFFPERCPLCGNIIPVNKNDCPDCDTDRMYISAFFCENCGYDKDRCICNNLSVRLSHVTAVSLYSGITKAQIQQFKFNGKKQYGKDFAHEMSLRVTEAFPKADFDCVTFVPMTDKAKSERSFNQSEYLAKHIAEKLYLPFDALLYKTRETEKQHKVSATERKHNLKGAFSLCENKDIKEKTILLCDDIKTTGNTLKECEAILLKNGAKDVYCICIALSDYGDVFPALDKSRETY